MRTQSVLPVVGTLVLLSLGSVPRAAERQMAAAARKPNPASTLPLSTREPTLDYGSLTDLEDGKIIDGILGSGITKGYVFEGPIKERLPHEFLWFTTAAPSPAERVAPGLVRWHASFAEAVTAARESGRPVLCFQLLGRLDDALC